MTLLFTPVQWAIIRQYLTRPIYAYEIDPMINMVHIWIPPA